MFCRSRQYNSVQYFSAIVNLDLTQSESEDPKRRLRFPFQSRCTDAHLSNRCNRANMDDINSTEEADSLKALPLQGICMHVYISVYESKKSIEIYHSNLKGLCASRVPCVFVSISGETMFSGCTSEDITRNYKYERFRTVTLTF